MAEHDLLIEIGTEELPPGALSSLSQAFRDEVEKGLEAASLAFSAIEAFASPRRLALIVRNLPDRQGDSTVEKLGPALQAAFDEAGNPTKAAEGFARSCGVRVADLEEGSDGKTPKLMYRAVRKGEDTAELVPGLIRQALDALPIPKRMRWGTGREEFVRPVHWVVLLYGDKVVPAAILGQEAGRATRGHRFHHPGEIPLEVPDDYETQLFEKGKVVAAFDKRRDMIREQVEREAEKLGGRVVFDTALLDEVTALVEWPVALAGDFDRQFLEIPKEALISSMTEHQKCFYLLDDEGGILPHFITVSNLESRDPAQVIHGNERVIRPRLADAAFFYEQDRRQPLEARREKLRRVIFQQQLGTVYDKSERVTALARHIAGILELDAGLCERAGQLAKCDLLTSMVYEFGELQGIMGYYYALHDGENEEVARALYEQYLPRFAGDELPATDTGTVLALAERLDTIVGLFGIGQPPTGSRDPYALRRAALGILRILVERNVELDLADCVCAAIDNFQHLPERDGLENAVLDFIFDRFNAWYADRGISPDVFQAVDAVRSTSPLEFDLRINAVSRFAQLPEAKALAAANKRVSNILDKLDTAPPESFDRGIMQEQAELTLAENLEKKVASLEGQFKNREYTAVLESLASLQQDVDRFFDEVMVNTDDATQRNNRLALLSRLRSAFLRIADISHLQTG